MTRAPTIRTLLDPTLRSPEVTEFEQALAARVVGQDRAVRRLAHVYQVYLAGLCAPGRPVANLLLLGPTGTGKTRLVEAAAEVLYGTYRAVLKVDCAEFQHSHEIAKLIGCFVPGTPVLLADGSSKPIESILVADRVISRGGNVRSVTDTHAYTYSGHVIELRTCSGVPVYCTPQHEVWRKRKWVRADELRAGDSVVCPQREPQSVPLESVKCVSYSGPVYDLTVEEEEAYAVGCGFIVHNSPPG